MTKIELLEYLTNSAKRFRKDEENLIRNSHLTGITEDNVPTLEQIDGVLTAFINHVGVEQGIDYALEYNDLNKEDK